MVSFLSSVQWLFFTGADHSGWEEGQPCEEEELSYQRVHAVLKALLQVIPMLVKK